MKEIKWAVLGCGVIANEMAVALQKNGKNIYAVGNRTHEKAAAFAEKYGIGKVYDDFHEMFTDPEVDVIYITTPHNTHLGFMKEAIANGKHILVEKSITLNSDELDEAIALAKEKGVIIGEAMTIYHMPIYKELKKILDSGRLGRVNLITMNFGSFKEYNMKNRFFNRNLAGGAMLDIGEQQDEGIDGKNKGGREPHGRDRRFENAHHQLCQNQRYLHRLSQGRVFQKILRCARERHHHPQGSEEGV